MPSPLKTDGPEGGRIFFSGAGRSLIEEDEIVLTSIGVDIGSSTSHLLFSLITLERLDTRYVVAGREVLYASDILLTPYKQDGDIDTDMLAAFIEREYAKSGIRRDEVDSGALILTGVAVRRRNARAIADLFAAEAGKFVSVSAGDRLETLMAAYGSGAVAASASGKTILNIDLGGGTTKIAVCKAGEVVHTTALEVGARLVVSDSAGRIIRLEEFGRQALGGEVELGHILTADMRHDVANYLAQQVMSAIKGQLDAKFMRLPELPPGLIYDGVIVSGGVSEYFYENLDADFGDLGQLLAQALREQLVHAAWPILPHRDGIRATVVGASQYTVQVSGSTVYIDPTAILPLRNVATIRPAFMLGDIIEPDAVSAAITKTLQTFDLQHATQPVAVALPWKGSATFARLDALTRGLVAGLAPILAAGHPLCVVADSDVGGLIGMHCRENGLSANPIVSIDGITLGAFDFIDVGDVLRATGSVPVVIKSLVFPTAPTTHRKGSYDE